MRRAPHAALRQVFALFCLALAAAVPAQEPPALLLAETWRGGIDVSHYLASEKLDGVRAYWDGRRLRSRRGHEFRAPQWFLDPLPARPLDGELWLGRGRFEELAGLLRRESPDEPLWRELRYMLFELPQAPGSYAERAAQLREIAARAGAVWIVAAEQFRLPDERALLQRLDAVIAAGGEGLMLHRADAPYETGRSAALLKVKRWQDAEAVVVAHQPGRGKYAGMVGALRVRTPDGREFALGTGFSDELRRHPPPVGATVTYRYRELTARGLPRHARFWRVREDF
jgi:DNA ligase-1